MVSQFRLALKISKAGNKHLAFLDTLRELPEEYDTTEKQFRYTMEKLTEHKGTCKGCSREMIMARIDSVTSAEGISQDVKARFEKLKKKIATED